jgi:hypothetical protein
LRGDRLVNTVKSFQISRSKSLVIPIIFASIALSSTVQHNAYSADLLGNITTSLTTLKDRLSDLKSRLETLGKKLGRLRRRLDRMAKGTVLPWRLSDEQVNRKTVKIQGTDGEISLTDQIGADAYWTFNKIDETQILYIKNYNAKLLVNVPAIGHYDSTEGYNWKARRLLVEMKPERHKTYIPKELIDCLPNPIQITAFHVIISGDFISSGLSIPTDKSYNFVFHGFCSLDEENNETFSHNINMGIFHPNGLETTNKSNPMPINKLEKRNVNFHIGTTETYTDSQGVPHTHSDYQCSPDNCRIKITIDRKTSTCWSVAVSKNNDRAIVTYHLFFNDVEIEKKFKSFAEPQPKAGEHKDFDDVLVFTENMKIDADLALSDPDQQCLQGFVAKMREMIEASPPAAAGAAAAGSPT